ncbi:MAG: hypothetical protein L6R39_002060 [Caloplaca ligustica]|nr:MAG: hypothetical protein L6R39_002060 [Caloplaca ligustica]
MRSGGQSTSSGDKLSDAQSEKSIDYISERLPTESSPQRSDTSSQGLEEQHSESQEAPPSARKSPPPRPNKHHGPDSTWRDHTAAERRIATSLNQLRASDLSIHLYNFHSLKRRAIGVTLGQYEGQEHEGHLTGSGKAWVSSKSWTAWPMLPGIVPREEGANPWEAGTSQGTITRRTTTSSSGILQEVLMARACKLAKERFYERECEDLSEESPATPSDPWLKRQAEILEMIGSPSKAEEDGPVVMADDEGAKAILQHSLNHILQKLEAMLMGLHQARNSYAVQYRSTVRSQAMTYDENSVDNKRKRRASRTSMGQRHNRRRKVTSHISEDQSATDIESEVPRASRSGSDREYTNSHSGSRSHHAPFGLRHWCDVLGVASMSGWDAKTIGRAAARCSTLFEEGIILRTLHEGQEGYRDASYSPRTLAARDLRNFGSMIPIPDISNLHQDSKVGGVHVDGFLQPIPKHRSWTPGRNKKGTGESRPRRHPFS